MTLRKALIGGTVLIAAVLAAVIGLVGALSISRTVFREAQQRVNHDLDTARTIYDFQQTLLAQRLQCALAGWDANDPRSLSLPAGVDGPPGTGRTPEPGDTGTLTGPGEQAEAGESRRQPSGRGPGDPLPASLAEVRDQLELVLLNVCAADGRRLVGTFPADAPPVAVSADPVLRRALAGRPAHGTVLLNRARLLAEGGQAVANLVSVAPVDGSGGTEAALFEWFAVPLKGPGGRTEALVYGGRPINHNYALVDRVRQVVFGPALYDGKPLGTVTVFLGPVRVATNVRGPSGQRAVGTVVSDEVRHAVLRMGERWQDRAWVVDAWYLSAYEPITDPDGRTIGMLYVGLLEGPYHRQRTALVLRFLLPVAGILLLAVLAAWLVVRRITQPLGDLQTAADRLARGDGDADVPTDQAFAELAALAGDFNRMRRAIQDRDEQVRRRNDQLADANRRLEEVNANYMQTLGFVTHELKSPLATVQMMIDTLVGGYVGEVSEPVRTSLVRIKRNCEELQDMVKNYLDLSRAERGEMQLNPGQVDLVGDVIHPSVEQNRGLFDSRSMTVTLAIPERLDMTADAELLRIAVSNFLSNAAKYGREGGQVRVTISRKADQIRLAVRNEGEGFTPPQREKLFAKFSRLENANTRGKRGSGLGLYLCDQIAGLHGGSVDARSEPGQWAEFSLTLPEHPPADTPRRPAE